MRLPFLLASLVAGATPAFAKECRMPDPPPGMQVQLPPECRNSVRARQLPASERAQVRADQGFIDLGGGTKLRVGGRVRAEVGIQP